ncbi:hypothetical protein J5N97_000155 [Dioscorea zingiberensis]|uniref:Uncharacterized protein n=1 Tax=Dioscorea zingiberensis TaxID=325984 RepID=A0A9D5BT13_9LILI|nr:hypothetical protein J5N97_000155 [Dioscorea zingiberensis]
MGSKPCRSSGDGLRRGAWTQEEDRILSSYIKAHGEGRWRGLPSRAETNKGGGETAQYGAADMDPMKAPDHEFNSDEIESWWDALMDFNVNDCNWMNESPPIHNAAEGEHDQVMLESGMDETRKPDFDLDLNDLAAFLNWEGGEL